MVNETPIATLCLLVEVSKIGVQLARQKQVIEQKRVCFFQIYSVYPSPFPDRTVIVLRQFNCGNIIVPSKDIIKAGVSI